MIIDKTFLRQELFVLKNQFIKWIQFLFFYNNITVAENKQFTSEFSDEDLLKGIILKK